MRGEQVVRMSTQNGRESRISRRQRCGVERQGEVTSRDYEGPVNDR